MTQRKSGEQNVHNGSVTVGRGPFGAGGLRRKCLRQPGLLQNVAVPLHDTFGRRRGRRRREVYFTTPINPSKSVTTSYLTFSGAMRRFISSKNLRAQPIFVCSMPRRSIEARLPLVSATK